MSEYKLERGHQDHKGRIYLYKKYERFWHWSQAFLVIFMLLTGFEIHGTYTLFGFGKAVNLHTLSAWALLLLWFITIFWQFTTGEWRQYLPRVKASMVMVRYYAIGMFRGEPNPYHKTAEAKHNPLQGLAYLGLLQIVSPVIWISGLFYLFYAYWSPSLKAIMSLQWVAWAHTAGAFMMLIFVIVHVYLTTTGHTPLAHIKTMITGWEDEEPEKH